MTIELLESLRSPQGSRALEEAALYDDPLKAVTTLRKSFPPELASAAVEMAFLRRKAVGRFPHANHMFFTRDAFEQASSYAVSAWRARRYREFSRVSDWCCGIGADSLALAEVTRIEGLDTDELRVAIAQANAEALGLEEQASFRIANCLAEPPTAGAVWADPSRRPGGLRVTHPDRYEPSLRALRERADSVPIGVKCSPAIAHGDIPPDAEAEFISLNGELKETVLWFGALKTADRRASILPEGLSMVPGEGRAPVRPPGGYLLDPDPAVARAGCVDTLAQELDAWRIDSTISYLSSDIPIHTPWAQTLTVLDCVPFNLKRIKALIRERGWHAEEVRKRGVTLDVDATRKALKNEGGAPVTLVVTRLGGKTWVLIAERRID